MPCEQALFKKTGWMLCFHAYTTITFDPKAKVDVDGRSSGLLNLSKSSRPGTGTVTNGLRKTFQELTAAGTAPVLHRIPFSPIPMVISMGTTYIVRQN